ncbi:Ni/Fe hydrogenase subunit alpha [Thermodesulfobacteriota bacterium]
MGKTITIDPVSRLEGHGKITIILNDEGDVDRAFFQVPELRGFEAFCIGRPAEDMPQITSRICGVCPTAHHMAGTKALDALYQVKPPEAARAVRELFYNMFIFEDHLLHFYYLGGPDFIVGPDAAPASRNILGVIEKVGTDTARRVLEIRKRCRNLMSAIGGKALHPVLGLPGGVAKAMSEEMRGDMQRFARDALDFAGFTLAVFEKIVLKNKKYLEMLLSEAYFDETHYMGLVDDNNKVNFFGEKVRVVDTKGNQVELFAPQEYTNALAEHVEEWSYVTFPYLKKVGWKGFVSGDKSGLLRVAPLARLNASDGMATPRAQEEYERLYETLGGKPAHNTLAWHWARLVEAVYAAERIRELADAEVLTGPDIRDMDLKVPKTGVGIVEAPRGTLIHHYETDEKGIITRANLMVATLFNSAPICLSIEKAARQLIQGGEVSEGILNRIEMAFRAYDPCFSCATHSLPGKMPLMVTLRDGSGNFLGTLVRGGDGGQRVVRKH